MTRSVNVNGGLRATPKSPSTRMRVLLRFENGVEAKTEVSGALPVCFMMRTGEGAEFWFEHRDELPSGVAVYAEVKRGE